MINKDTLRAALEGAVNPLEWEDDDGFYTARCLGLEYQAYENCDGSMYALTVYHMSNAGDNYDGIDIGDGFAYQTPFAAQEAARADLPLRILSAIDLDTLAAKLGGGE
jgi:hypothetical protein